MTVRFANQCRPISDEERGDDQKRGAEEGQVEAERGYHCMVVHDWS